MSLRLCTARADKSDMSSLRTLRRTGALRSCERGQAVVEFALILPVFIILVAGIIRFGIALNYWLDLQRVANQGARWAVVNRYPVPTGNADYPACTDSNKPCSPTLQGVLGAQRLAKGENTTPCITFPANSGPVDPNTGFATPTIGDPVKVSMRRKFSLGIPFLPLGVDITGSATMRLEQVPTVYSAADNPAGC